MTADGQNGFTLREPLIKSQNVIPVHPMAQGHGEGIFFGVKAGIQKIQGAGHRLPPV
jgi:hypothetical protein